MANPDDLGAARRIMIERQVNAMLSTGLPGPMSSAVKQRLRELIPLGWEWQPLEHIDQQPQVVITRT